MKSFNQLPPHSRIWIYQSARELSADEVSKIKTLASAFINQWTSHGSNMDAAIEVLHNLFVIVGVDEQTASASGCGIDKSLRFIQDVEKQFNLSLLDRTRVAFKEANTVLSCSLAEFEALITSNKVNENTIVFNNLVASKSDLTTNWELPLKQSWQGKMLVK